MPLPLLQDYVDLNNSIKSNAANVKLSSTPAWQALKMHHAEMANIHMRDLFDADPDRFARMSCVFEDLLLDYSKNRIRDETLKHLVALAEQQAVPVQIERLFSGAKVNSTEQRAALHTALRADEQEIIEVDGRNIVPEVHGMLARMADFAEAIHSGQWRGHCGKPISDIVNIGIGGSDLGPALVTEALRPYRQGGLDVHFVSNVEGSDLATTFSRLDPDTTLFLIASKSFGTWETIANAEAAREWLVAATGSREAVARHFVALSNNKAAALEFGIAEDNVFELWDWVGGRYSIWSVIGLAAVLYLGMEHFRAFLAGARAMDHHFRCAPLDRNMPVILALLGIWYNNFFGAETHAILPYEQHLRRLPPYVQQLDMESNGKHVTHEGVVPDYAVGPVIWGALGGKGQHAFYQLLHQGARLVPADFLVPVESHHPLGDQHEIMVANCFAQTQALMRGRTEEEARERLAEEGLSDAEIERLLPHKIFPGNNPSNTLLYQKLTPRLLGSLLALYEHKTYVQGVIWGVNSFDQMGVELGKSLARDIYPSLTGGPAPNRLDASTKELITAYHARKKTGPKAG